MMRCQEKKDAAAAMGEKRSKSFFVTPQLLCRMGWMNGGKGREGNDVAARLAVAGLTIQQATVVHPPGMAWDGLAWGWAARSPFGPDDEYPILDPFSLRNPPRPRPRRPRPRPRLTVTVAVAVVAVSRPPVSVCRNIRVAILVAPPTNAVAFRTSTSKRLVRYFASLVYHAMLPVPPRYTDTGKYRTNRNMFIQSTGVK